MRRDKQLKLTTIEDAGAAAIHKAVLRVLWDVGAAIDDAEVRAWLIRDHGCRESDDGRLRFPPELIERALETVPRRVALFDRDGALRVAVDGQVTVRRGDDLGRGLERLGPGEDQLEVERLGGMASPRDGGDVGAGREADRGHLVHGRNSVEGLGDI